jgi:hypothetical protein
VLNAASVDWMRYSLSTWIVYTPRDAQQLFEKLRPLVSLSDSILVTRIVPGDRAGYLPKWAWDWLDRNRGVPRLPPLSPTAPSPKGYETLDRGRGLGQAGPYRGILGLYADQLGKPVGGGALSGDWAAPSADDEEDNPWGSVPKK